MTTAITSTCPLLLLLLLLGCLGHLVHSRTLLLNNCSVDAHTHEMRKHYSSLREGAISGDTEVGVKLLNKSWITGVESGQKCCLVRLVLRFYIERVFGNYPSLQAQERRCCSALANAFITIRRSIHKCNCTCSEETQRTVDSLQTEYNKLAISKAARKAVGELDTVLGWLEGLEERSLP